METPTRGLDALRADGGREFVAGRELESEIAESQRKRRGRARARTMTEAVVDGGAVALRPVLFCAALAAYVAAQCSVRELGAISECWQPLLVVHTSAMVSGPVMLWRTVVHSFWEQNASAQHQLPTPLEALNTLGGTVGVLIIHELLRYVFVGLVWYSRRSDTSWDDVLFGCGARASLLLLSHRSKTKTSASASRTGDVSRCTHNLR